jgi:hypothetical protein
MAMHRKILLGIGIVLLALVVFAGVRIVQRITAKPTIAIDYGVQVREHIEASARARGLSPDKAVDARFEAVVLQPMLHAQAFVKAIAAKDPRFAQEVRRIPPVDYTLVDEPEPRTASTSEVQLELAKLAYADAIATGQLDKLLELRELRGALREWKLGEAIMLQSPPLTVQARFAARLIGVRLREQLATGDAVGATRTAETLLALGTTISGHGTLIESLVGLASQAVAFDAMRQAASRPGMERSMARAMLDVLAQRPRVAPAALSLETERMLVLDTVQRVFSDDGEGDGFFMPAEWAKISGESATAVAMASGVFSRFASRRETTDKAQRYFDAAITASAEHRGDRKLIALTGMNASLTPRDVVLQLMLPSVSKFMTSFDRFETTIAATQTLLAIELYRAQHGTPPASLDALVPSILPALPADVFAPDGRLRYALRTPTPDDARDFVLYSVGGDGEDNGGTFLEGDKRELALSMSSDAKGYDWPAQLP